MPTMINRGKELIRISPSNTMKLEYSVTNGRTWTTRYSGNSMTGEFFDLMDNGQEILGTTERGLYYSRTEGRTWVLRKR